jgi:hypothetical protein
MWKAREKITQFLQGTSPGQRPGFGGSISHRTIHIPFSIEVARFGLNQPAVPITCTATVLSRGPSHSHR